MQRATRQNKAATRSNPSTRGARRSGGKSAQSKTLPSIPVKAGDAAANAVAAEILRYENRIEEVLYTVWWYDLCRRFQFQTAAVARANNMQIRRRSSSSSTHTEDGNDPPVPTTMAEVYAHVAHDVLTCTEVRRLRGRWLVYRIVHELYYSDSRMQGVGLSYYWAMMRAVWHAIEVAPMHRKIAAWHENQFPHASTPSLRELYVLRCFYDVVTKHGVDRVYVAMSELTLPPPGDASPGMYEERVAHMLESMFAHRLQALRNAVEAPVSRPLIAPETLVGLVGRAIVAAQQSSDARHITLLPFLPLSVDPSTVDQAEDPRPYSVISAALPAYLSALKDDTMGSALVSLVMRVNIGLAGYFAELSRALAPEAAMMAMRAESRARAVGNTSAQHETARQLIVSHRVTEWVDARRARARREFLDLSVSLDTEIDETTLAARTTEYDRLLEALGHASFDLRMAMRPSALGLSDLSNHESSTTSSTINTTTTINSRGAKQTRTTHSHSGTGAPLSTSLRKTTRHPIPGSQTTRQQHVRERSLSRRPAQRPPASPNSSPTLHTLPTLGRQRSRSLSHVPGTTPLTRSSSAANV